MDRNALTIPARRNLLRALAADIRIGLRMIGRMPLLACAVILILSLGIGVASGVFTLLNTIAFRPAVDEDSASFFYVKSTRNDFTIGEYHAFRDQARSVRALAAWAGLPSG